jgi:hypothetical protein
MFPKPLWRSARRVLALAVVVCSVLALAGPRPARAAEVDVYVPPDTTLLVTVNVKQIVNSDIFKKSALGPIKDALKDAPEISDVFRDLGFDPFTDLDRVLFASPGGKAPDRGLTIAHGKFNLAKFRARANEALRDNPDNLKLHKVGDGASGKLDVYEVILNEDSSLFVALASERTILASPGKDYVVEGIKRGRAKAKVALRNKDFQALLERVDTKQGVSLAVLSSALAGAEALDSAPAMVKGLIDRTEALGGSIAFGMDEIRFEVAVAAKNAADARAFKESTDRGLKLALAALLFIADQHKGLEVLTEVVKTVRTTARGKVVTITGRLTGEALDGALKKGE